jgi:hypothetical protein
MELNTDYEVHTKIYDASLAGGRMLEQRTIGAPTGKGTQGRAVRSMLELSKCPAKEANSKECLSPRVSNARKLQECATKT